MEDPTGVVFLKAGAELTKKKKAKRERRRLRLTV